MATTFKMIIEYDGGAYCGWQIQNEVSTIQGEIENALHRMTGQTIRVTASGRTDTGVHALGQIAGFRCDTTLSETQRKYHAGGESEEMFQQAGIQLDYKHEELQKY